jgi:hypothetical protein
MKVCPADSGCIAFETIEEFEAAFRRLADDDDDDEELTGDTCVEGNSGLMFETVKEWVDYFGLENVYFGDTFEHGSVEKFFFDLRGARHNGKVWIMNADEVSIENGFLRLWFG